MTTKLQQTLWTPAGELPLIPAPPEEKAMFDPAVDRPVGKPSEDPEREKVPDASGLVASSVPRPSGYRILCFVPEVEKEFGSGLQKADITIQQEELLCTVLFAAKLGPDCYADKVRFPSGPWCKEGDFILVRPMVGTRVKIHGRQCRIINDDCVEAVVDDPRGISRSF